MKQVTAFLPGCADQELAEIQGQCVRDRHLSYRSISGEPMPTVSEMGQLWSIHAQ